MLRLQAAHVDVVYTLACLTKMVQFYGVGATTIERLPGAQRLDKLDGFEKVGHFVVGLKLKTLYAIDVFIINLCYLQLFLELTLPFFHHSEPFVLQELSPIDSCLKSFLGSLNICQNFVGTLCHADPTAVPVTPVEFVGSFGWLDHAIDFVGTDFDFATIELVPNPDFLAFRDPLEPFDCCYWLVFATVVSAVWHDALSVVAETVAGKRNCKPMQ